MRRDRHDVTLPFEVPPPIEGERRTIPPVQKTRRTKTHCENGHEYTPENTRTTKKGRRCRACARASDQQGARRQAERDGRLFRANPRHAPTKECRVCGNPTPANRLRYCSDECYKRRRNAAKRQMIRARKYNAPSELVDSYAVFERDNWVCQFCGVEAPKVLRGTYHDLAPEIDHPLPLDMGGPNTYENSRCCHRVCNATKRACIETGTILYGYVKQAFKETP